MSDDLPISPPFVPGEYDGRRRAQPRPPTPREKNTPRSPSTRTEHKSSIDTLDGGWDRRLRQGSVAPERTIDLHGHTLTSAQAALEQALARAVADDVRLLLVITGKPPRAEDKRRGLIRASIGDWLGGSGYRDRIAAVRHAHPRHGGAGALYLILRRRRGE
ncbi:MAG TPA: Smr/MutS family protein [Sphingomonas sp.]|nr:Smr/MutS family protein [Sphingomonas sp.]